MRQTPSNPLRDLALLGLKTTFIAKAKQAHEIQKELQQFFKVPALTGEEIVKYALLLTSRCPTDFQMAEAMTVYAIGGVFRSALGSDYLPYTASVLRKKALDEYITRLKRNETLLEEFGHLYSDLEAFEAAHGQLNKKDLVTNWWHEVGNLRKQFRQRLGDLKLEPTKALKKIEAEEESLNEEVFKFPDGISSIRLIWLSEETLCKLALSKIAEKVEYEDELWDRLAQCIRPDCEAFFLRDPRKDRQAGPPRKYCNPECMRIVNNRDSAVRKARSRAARKKK